MSDKRCKHERADVKENDGRMVHAACPDCNMEWMGADYDWRSHRGRLHKPPGWVKAAMERASTGSPADALEKTP